MKRQVQELGIRDWWGDDLTQMQNEILAAIEEGILKPLGNVVIAGCTVTANGGNWNIAAGIVYVDGRICRFAGATAVTLPGYLKLTTTNTQDLYSDGNNKDVLVEYTATFQTAVPGTPYITIRSTGQDRIQIAKLSSQNVLSGLPKSDSPTSDDPNTLATSKAVNAVSKIVNERGIAYFYAQDEAANYAPLQVPDFRNISGNNLAGTLNLAGGRHFQMRRAGIYKVTVIQGDAVNLELRTASATFNAFAIGDTIVTQPNAAPTDYENANFYWSGAGDHEIIVEFLGLSQGF